MAERAESAAGTKEGHSTLTYRLRWRVLLSGFYPQKGESLLPSAVGLGPFWVLVNLLTGLVAPTTCSVTTCLTTCMEQGEAGLS